MPDFLLSIERSSPRGGFALYRDGSLLLSRPFEAGLPRSPAWFTDIVDALNHVEGLAPDSPISYLVGTGPGSFSGIRSVIAALQGLAMPRNRPVLGLSSAAAAARELAVSRGAGTVSIVGDARRGRAWHATYDLAGDGTLRLHATGAAPSHTPADFSLVPYPGLAAALPAGAPVASAEISRVRSLLATIPAALVVEEDLCATAESLAALYFSNPAAAIRDPVPVYLQPAVATSAS